MDGPFAHRWRQGPIREEEVPELARQLEASGAKDYTQEIAGRLTGQALEHLEAAHPAGEAAEGLRELALRLVGRKK
jgi:geranylgeranyl pyrophosphate synthase